MRSHQSIEGYCKAQAYAPYAIRACQDFSTRGTALVMTPCDASRISILPRGGGFLNTPLEPAPTNGIGGIGGGSESK